MLNKIDIDLICKICGQNFKSLDPIGSHLKLKHNMTTEQYYKQYIDNTDYKCLTCNNPVTFISLTVGYRKYCCSTCASRNKTWLLNREKTYIKKYGAKTYSSTDEFKDKVKQTCLDKYGVEYYTQTKECKDKIKQTCLDKYGVEHYTQTQEYILKTKETNNKKYNKDYYLQTNECHEKTKQTTLKKYGVEHYAQTQECKDKIKQTCLDKYGVEYYTQTQEHKDKTKLTCLDKYGFENYAQTQECKDKIKQTCLDKYGLSSVNQVHDIICKQHSKFKINNKIYDSKWEYVFEQYLIRNNINFIYHPDISFEYFYDNKKHLYFPDFIINGKELIELKGLHFFENFNNQNKMINPYNRDLDNLAEAKHQCMIKNNVTIITDITPYL